MLSVPPAILGVAAGDRVRRAAPPPPAPPHSRLPPNPLSRFAAKRKPIVAGGGGAYRGPASPSALSAPARPAGVGLRFSRSVVAGRAASVCWCARPAVFRPFPGILPGIRRCGGLGQAAGAGRSVAAPRPRGLQRATSASASSLARPHRRPARTSGGDAPGRRSGWAPSARWRRASSSAPPLLPGCLSRGLCGPCGGLRRGAWGYGWPRAAHPAAADWATHSPIVGGRTRRVKGLR